MFEKQIIRTTIVRKSISITEMLSKMTTFLIFLLCVFSRNTRMVASLHQEEQNLDTTPVKTIKVIYFN